MDGRWAGRCCPVVGERLGRELVPDGLWEIVEPLIPPQRERPQGGGTRYVEDRAVLDRLGEQAAIDWSRAVVDAASVRAKRGAR